LVLEKRVDTLGIRRGGDFGVDIVFVNKVNDILQASPLAGESTTALLPSSLTKRPWLE